MRNIQMLLFQMILLVLFSETTSCHGRKILPREISINLTDSLNVNLGKECLTYRVEIFNENKLIGRVAFKNDRRNKSIAAWSIQEKDFYGEFIWPDPLNSIYFGVAPFDEGILYFSNSNYFRVVDLQSGGIDTIQIKSNITEMVNMIVVDSVVYSINNVYGIDIIDLSNTENQILLQGNGSNPIQNNISLPVNSCQNLIGGIEPDTFRNMIRLFAIDSAMVVKWERDFTNNNRNMQVKPINMGKYYVVKHDSILELLSKQNGEILLSRTFANWIYDVYRINEKELLIFSSDVTFFPIFSFNILENANKKISLYDILNDEVIWELNGLGSNGIKSFLLKDMLYEYNGNKEWLMININTGQIVDTFKFSKNIEIVIDKMSGKKYLFFDEKVYW